MWDETLCLSVLVLRYKRVSYVWWICCPSLFYEWGIYRCFLGLEIQLVVYPSFMTREYGHVRTWSPWIIGRVIFSSYLALFQLVVMGSRLHHCLLCEWIMESHIGQPRGPYQATIWLIGPTFGIKGELTPRHCTQPSFFSM